jgi:hypothetical protein
VIGFRRIIFSVSLMLHALLSKMLLNADQGSIGLASTYFPLFFFVLQDISDSWGLNQIPSSS